MLSKSVLRSSSALLTLTILVGCATPPDRVSASDVSPMQSSDSSYTQIKSELRRVQRQLVQVTGAQ